MGIEEIIALAGFDVVGMMPASELNPRPEVRDMCRDGNCGKYGVCWACPPHCGSLEHYAQLMAHRDLCYLVQTVGELEDPFDIESIYETERKHKACMRAIEEGAREARLDVLIFSSGSCDLCEACTCPNEPCRFPDRVLVSMEAGGIIVSEACVAAGIPHNHGECTICFTGAVLV